jgi:hypothetical protein
MTKPELRISLHQPEPVRWQSQAADVAAAAAIEAEALQTIALARRTAPRLSFPPGSMEYF